MPPMKPDRVNKCRVRAVYTIRSIVAVTQKALGHVEDQERPHAVVGESLPHLGKEQREQANGMSKQSFALDRRFVLTCDLPWLTEDRSRIARKNQPHIRTETSRAQLRQAGHAISQAGAAVAARFGDIVGAVASISVKRAFSVPETPARDAWKCHTIAKHQHNGQQSDCRNQPGGVPSPKSSRRCPGSHVRRQRDRRGRQPQLLDAARQRRRQINRRLETIFWPLGQHRGETFASKSGTSGRSSRTSGGGSLWWASSFCSTVPSGNGGRPVSMKNNVQPSE